MRRLILFLVCLGSATGLFAQTDSLYIGAKKVYFKIRKDRVIVKSQSEPEAQTLSKQTMFFDAHNVGNLVIATIDSTKTNLEVLRQAPNTADIAYALECTDGTFYYPTNMIFVKLKKEHLIEKILDSVGLSKNVKSIELDRETNETNTYMIILNVNLEGILLICRNLYETGVCEFAEPNFMLGIRSNNTYYPNQWNLNNTGQIQYADSFPRIDINVVPVWDNITKGDSSIVIAVLDDGVDLTHPDLQANLLQGADFTINPPGGVNGGQWGDDVHGTMVSGTIAGVDNEIGVIGVAPGCKIVPIRINYKKPSSPDWQGSSNVVVRDAIKYAYVNARADIINCSWSGVNLSSIIVDEINAAATQGRIRNGIRLGCIVVGSSGNDDKDTVNLPARMENVLAVGALSPCGERKCKSINPYVFDGVSCDGERGWGSNYGQDLDIMAPGIGIYTTDIQGSAGHNKASGTAGDYYHNFNGTSASAPMVAGVAALILSVNPNLTAVQVRDIIKSTAQKVRTDLYDYQEDPNRPGFNHEVGYGLVDAYAAVRTACNNIDHDLMIRDDANDVGIEPTPDSVDTWSSPDIWTRYRPLVAVPHQDPISDRENSVLVRVTNRGCLPSFGTERLAVYWSKAYVVDPTWPDGWNGTTSYYGTKVGDSIGEVVIPPTPPGKTSTMIFPWKVPKPTEYAVFNGDSTTFYLLARITDPYGNDTIVNPSWQSKFLIRANNNVAGGKVSIINTADLMIGDNNGGDKGQEPNESTEIFYRSPNIWIRNDKDSGTVHQNPIGNCTNYVYVRLENITKYASRGAEQLYLHWSKAGAYLGWPYAWNGGSYFYDDDTYDSLAPMGGLVDSVLIPQVSSGKSIILEIPWFVPDPAIYQGLSQYQVYLDEPWHFCLLARIVAPNIDPMTYPETSDVNYNTKYNNNIAWANVSVIETHQCFVSSVIYTTNWDLVTRSFCLKFVPSTGSATLYQEAEVTVKVDPVVYNAWVRGGSICEDITVMENNTFLIAGTNARLCNLIFEPEEVGLASVRFNFLIKEMTAQEEYEMHVVQTDYDEGEIIGGEVYAITKAPRTPFYAYAEDVFAYQNEQIVLAAEDIGEPAQYRWYNEDGDLVCEEMDFETVATHEQEFKLEVISLLDGYKDYAEVSVNIIPNENRIEELFPNPSTGNLMVRCVFNNVSAAYLSISDYYGLIYDERDLSTSPQSVNFSTQNYPTGTYFVKLICDGQTVDTKTFVKQ